MRLQQKFQDLQVDHPEAVKLPDEGCPHVADPFRGHRRIVCLLIGLFVLSGHKSLPRSRCFDQRPIEPDDTARKRLSLSRALYHQKKVISTGGLR